MATQHPPLLLPSVLQFYFFLLFREIALGARVESVWCTYAVYGLAFAFVSDPWESVRCVTVFVAHGACRRGLEGHCGDNT